MMVKVRPSLIIGCEPDCHSTIDVDYELMIISKISNFKPHHIYDYVVGNELQEALGLNYKSYIRTHKIYWNNVKHIEVTPPIGNLLDVNPELFNHMVSLNEKWVKQRSEHIRQILKPNS